MQKKRIIKLIVILVATGIVIAAGVALYMYNMPHRDVQSQEADYSLTSTQIVNEYLSDKKVANEKYLTANGESKVLEITGTIDKITEDYDGNKVILLQEPNQKAGVSATFMPQTNAHTEGLIKGQTVTIKGVIRSGASYDEDLEMYENVIVEKSDIIKK